MPETPQGRLLEEGTHLELLNNQNSGARGYASLCEAQNLRSLDEEASTPRSPNEPAESPLRKQADQVGAVLEFEEGKVKDEATQPAADGDEQKEENGEDVEEDEEPPHNPCDIWTYNKPEFPLFALGLFCALISGAAWPVFAYIVTEMLNVFYTCNDLTAPLLVDEANPCAVSFAVENFPVNSTAHLFGACQTFNDAKMDKVSCSSILDNLQVDQSTCHDNIRTQIDWMCLAFVIVGVVTGVAQTLTHIIFDYMGQHLTHRLRQASFNNILRQNIGWFDEKANSTGALSLQLSTDAALVKNTKGTRLGTTIDQVCSVVVALILCFTASWQLTIIMVLSCMVTFVAMSLHTQVSAVLLD